MQTLGTARQSRRLLVVVGGFAGWAGSPRTAQADTYITKDAAAPQFTVELEPHAVLSPFRPPRGGTDGGVGAGLLVGINVAPRGLLPTVNDSVSVGVGLDWVQYFGGAAVGGQCAEWAGSGNEALCVRVQGAGTDGTHFFVPGVMQWNFYFSPQWSAFGEPGFSLYFYDVGSEPGLSLGVTPIFNLGGRYHFSERAALTMRIGYPYTTVGFSFYL